MKMKYIFITFTVLVGFFGIAASQEQLSHQERADKLFYEYQYANAIPIYLKLVDSKKPELADLEHLAACYFKINDYKNAELWYAKVIEQPESAPENYLRYADVLKANSKYPEAKQAFKTYGENVGDAASTLIDIAGCDSAMLWSKEAPTYQIRNERAVNTELSEFAAFPMGDKVLYAGERDSVALRKQYGWTGNSYLYIYAAERGEGNTLQNPTISKEIFNDQVYHVGPLISTKSGDTLYVTRTYSDKKEAEINKETKRKYRTHNLELYIYSKNSKGEWEAKPFQYNNTKTYSLGHATLSNDEQILYYVSDMPGGLGGTDIWYSEKLANGAWGEPQNAGAIINTTGDEMFPNMDTENSLYYSSDGLAGLGGLDVFKSEGGKGSWSKPVNLKIPVNSPGDDFAFIVNEHNNKGMAGYISSNRADGAGGDDIYSFTYEKPKILLVLIGKTYNKSTKELLPATAVMLRSSDNELIEQQSTGKDGAFIFSIDPEKTYKVLGTKENFTSDSVNVSTTGIIKSDTLEVALYLDPAIKKGMTFRLENILYDFDKSNIRKDAAIILDKLVKIMKEYPALKIELSSHTDSRGSDSYNMALSDRRAKSAVEYLVTRGIARERMVASGYGESRLLNRCSNGVSCSIPEHQLNRRTEVTILED